MPKKVSNMSSLPSNFSNSWNSGEYYKVIRLRTGETLLCILDNDIESVAAETYLTLIRPVQAVIADGPNSRRTTQDNLGVIATDYKLKMWIDASDSKEFVIDTSIILTIGNMSPRIRYQYDEYVKLMDETERAFAEHTHNLRTEAAIVALLTGITPWGYTILDEEVNDEEDPPTLRGQ